ncbi:hypothetical protein [Sphingopyxis sp.]|uniref:hypothetical protein n=1 Tax=Sphingopyxis sp. TaxID=1908224 RepID=UPI003D11D99A
MTKIDARIGGMVAAALCLIAPLTASADEAVSESDRFFLDEAASACRSGDFPAFLWPFANSKMVRERYGAPAASDFPIVMIDYSYVTSASEKLFEAKGDPRQLVTVQIDFSTPSVGAERVDWVPGRFEPGEGDGPGTLIEKIGPGGSLHFTKTADCWQLTKDIRNLPSAR